MPYYVMLIIPMAFFIIFKYWPMFGLSIAFQNYKAGAPFLGGNVRWVGLRWFKQFFSYPFAWRLITNTLILSVYNLAVTFPLAIFLALILNEIRNRKVKEFTTTLSFLPYFISTTVVVGMMTNFLNINDGIINQLIVSMGGTAKDFMGASQYFRTLYVLSGCWKNLGFDAIAGIDPGLYEAAFVDGSTRFKNVFLITLPNILPTIIILIMRVGHLMSVGHEKVILMYNNTVNPTVLPGVTADDVGIYCITGKVSPDIGHIVWMYNTEWLEKLGKTVPTTLDEFYDLCVAMKEAGDLNGNGVDDEIILTSSGLSTINGILGNSFGLEQYEDWDAFVADENGVVTDEYTSDAMRELLTFENKLYEEGILDPSITKTSADEMSQKIAADQVGIFVYYSAFALTYGRLTTKGQADPMAEIYTLGGPLEGPHGDQYYVYRDRVGGDATGVSTKSEHIELALKWLDVLTSDPVVIMTRTCGWEGENYSIDENGDVQLIYPEDGSPWSIGQYGCGQIAMPHYQTYDQMMNSRKNIDWYMDEYNAILDMDCFIHPSVPQMGAYTEEEYELIDMSKSDVSAYFREMRAKFIAGEADIETEWDSYVDTMYALGLQDWIDAEQSIYDRTR